MTLQFNRKFSRRQDFGAAVDRDGHSTPHIDCPKCDRAREVTVGRISSDLTFAEAAKLWIESRSLKPSQAPVIMTRKKARFIKENTKTSYQAYIDTLNLFFGMMPLEKIHLGNMREYQEARVNGDPPFIRYRRPQDAKPKVLKDGTVIPAKGKTPCPASAKKCNQELSILKTILRRAGCWTEEMDENYESFDEEVSEVPRALTPDEQQRWLEVARSQQRWWLVYWYSILAFETSMSTDEIRGLRIGDINLFHEILNVRDGKNQYRAGRTIPLLSAEVKWACEQLLARARDMGAADSTHYLFPFQRYRVGIDPTRPMTVGGIKKPWNEVRFASRLDWFRPYDTRHTAITRWAENGMEIPTIMSMAGHVTQRMMKHYTHISNQAKRRAIAAVPRMGPKSEGGWAPFYVSGRLT